MPKVALVVDMAISKLKLTVRAPPMQATPDTSQSPAVKEILVMLVAVALVSETPLAVDLTYSPTLPAVALLTVVTPTRPPVGVMGPAKTLPSLPDWFMK